MNENELIMKSQKGDIESFEILIENYQKYAFNIAYQMMKNYDDASDITQEAFIKVFKYIKNFKMDATFSTWLYRIVINTCKDEFKKRKKIETISIDEEDSYKEVKDDSKTPDEILESMEIRSKIDKAINSLSPNYKEIIVLRDVNELSYKEISETLDVPIGTIKSRISRARIELRNLIRKEDEDGLFKI